jgi:hypothetical protein
MSANALGTALFTALVVVVLYKRLRRSVGRQRIEPPRLVLRIVIFGSLAVLITSLLLISSWPVLGVGVLGAGLGWLAVRLTTFERDVNGSYYTPNGLIGITVFALFLGRIVYRLVTIGPILGAGNSDQNSLLGYLDRQDGPPITLAMFFLLVVFYVTYYGGVLIRSRANV